MRLDLTITHCRCILDDIKVKLFSRKISEIAQHFFNSTFMGPFWTKVKEWNDVSSFIDLERALHKNCNRIPKVMVQRLIFSMMRRCVGAGSHTRY